MTMIGDDAIVSLAVKQGRRWSDIVALVEHNGVSLFFWLFGIFLDEKHKPSMSRLLLAGCSWVGWLCVRHELNLVAGQTPLQNAVWTAWWAAEGALTLAVFGPRVASYFGPGAAGAVAASAIGSAARDALARRARAAVLGEDGTEYTP